jgi:hypothetical protein
MRVSSDGYVLTRDEFKVLTAISNGFPVKVDRDTEGRYILVANPDYKPDNGSDPYLVLSLSDKSDYYGKLPA